MRKNIGTIKWLLGSLALFLCYSAIQANIFWEGQDTPDVVNENLYILGDCQLNSDHEYDYVRITATSQSIDVYLTTSEPTIVAGTDGVPTLFLEPIGGDITFHVTHDLKFLGAEYYDSEAAKQPLLIAVRGGRKVIFELNGKSVSFEPNLSSVEGVPHGGSVKFYVIMDGSIVEFKRTTSAPGNDCFVTLGNHAAFGYASDKVLSTSGVGTILFDPTNSGSGRTILSIRDRASVLVSGRYADLAMSYSLTLDDIDKSVPAGCQAIFDIENSNTNAASRLLVLNCNRTLYQYQMWHPSTFTGKTYGFILGCNGLLNIGALSYLDYVGLSLDKCFTGDHAVPCSLDYLIDSCLCNYNCAGFRPDECCTIPAEKVFKKRNPSALVVDGCCDAVEALPACINLENQSAIVFRSGINCEGQLENGLASAYPFTISPIKRSTGPGNMVLDVEGCLTIAGTGTDRFFNQTKLEILSLNVTPTGATVLINGSGSTNFPARDFATDSQDLLRAYNTAYFFINNNVILCKTFLVHTDQNHKVYDCDDVRSEPAYVGGEIFKIRGTSRPKLLFSNSTFMIHTSAASTGVDFVVPNALECCLSCSHNNMSNRSLRNSRNFAQLQRSIDCYPTTTCSLDCSLTPTCLFNASPCDNVSRFLFFYNGYAKDKGTGRDLILGTVPGSMTCDCLSVVSQDSHVDVMQLADQSCTCSNEHELIFAVAPNNSTIIEGVPDNIQGQYTINTIYLGHGSNISIGSPTGAVPENYSCPIFTIDGSYFSFQSRGGALNKPQISNISGQGGIFVDNNGTIQAINTCGLTMGAMVTKSGNGVIDLPESTVKFGCGLGEADWRLDLLNTPTIIASGTVISDYVLNWNTCCIGSQFVPYTCDCTACPGIAATESNINGAPVVLGEVDQLIVRGSRIGDPATVLVGKGGYVRELVFPDSCRKGESATGVVILEDDGYVGIGSAHTNVDSLYGSVVLGNNGITIIANGDGRVHLNEDVVINNVCHIVQGPDFASEHRLLIESDCCRTILVKSNGVLDLSTFTTGTQVSAIQLGGEVQLVLEPGATVVMGSCTLQFVDHAGIVCKPVSPDAMPTDEPDTLRALDDFRVKFIGGTDSVGAGQGKILFDDCSYCIINENAFAGVETGCGLCNGYTDLIFELRKKAKFTVGDCLHVGGAFQVGDTCCTDTLHSINFELLINGREAEFAVGQGAFVGLGSVIAQKLQGSVPNYWSVGQAGNVDTIKIIVNNGIFTHNIIEDGSSSYRWIGSLLAIGQEGTYTLDFTTQSANQLQANVSQSTIRGGGNMMLVSNCPAPITPDITCKNTSSVGILASSPIFKPAYQSYTGIGSGLFAFWRYVDFAGNALKYANYVDVGPSVLRNQIIAAYVQNGSIMRLSRNKVTGGAGVTNNQQHSLDIGAAIATLDPNGLVTPCEGSGVNPAYVILNLSIIA